MERKRQWIDTGAGPSEGRRKTGRESTSGAARSSGEVSDGHTPLLWGSLGVLIGYGGMLLGALLTFGTALAAIALLVLAVGAVTWVVGITQRIRYNRKAEEPILFTPGEKAAILGAVALVVGILLVAGDLSEGEPVVGQIVGLIGLLAAAGGTIWHLLTPRV